jgi:hypothetical protein
MSRFRSSSTRRALALAAPLLATAVIVAGCGGVSYGSGSSHAGAKATTPTEAAPSAAAATPAAPAAGAPAQESSASGIPQNNGGDQDADNNGGPSDGDGNL